MADAPFNNTNIKPSDISLLDIVKAIKNGTEYETRFTNIITFIEENANFATVELIIALSLSMSKGTLIKDYVFDASAKTITFSAFAEIDISRILTITNVTDNIIVYNFASDTTGGTAATNVLTLTYDTTAMADADNLQIYYDMGSLVKRVDEASATVTYVGQAQDGSDIADPVWQIQRITSSGGATEIEWADGNNDFDNEWDGRAGLTYS